MRILGAAVLAAMLVTICGCENNAKVSEGHYAGLIDRSGNTGMKGTGPFAEGSDRHPGYTELPFSTGAAASIAPSTGNHSAVTWLSQGSRGNGIADDSGGIGIGMH